MYCTFMSKFSTEFYHDLISNQHQNLCFKYHRFGLITLIETIMTSCPNIVNSNQLFHFLKTFTW